MKKYFSLVWVYILINIQIGFSQSQWTKDGNSFYEAEKSEIVKITLPSENKQVIMAANTFTKPIQSFIVSADENLVLLFTNTKKVWRYETKGDYYVYNKSKNSVTQLGKSLPASSLMFAKISNNGKYAAYVSNSNMYVEDLSTNTITPITTNGQRRFINGTFDWVYEEEFDCRDGFRISPDGSKIAFWEVDAQTTRDFYMINNTDSVYSSIIPVEYPKVGERPSDVRILVYEVTNKNITPLQITGNKEMNFYIPAIEWTLDSKELIIQQLDRKQQVSNLWLANATTGAGRIIYTEKDEAWIDSKNNWQDDAPAGWLWLENGKSFLWLSEKDGWKHAYKISTDGKKEVLLTPGNYDVMSIKAWDEKKGDLFFMASPNNATQRYLYKANLKKAAKATRVTPSNIEASCYYDMSPNGAYSGLRISGTKMSMPLEWVITKTHKNFKGEDLKIKANDKNNVEFFQVTTQDGVTLDGWMVKPENFDENKKYPVLFYVYGEPASATVVDRFGSGMNGLYAGNMAKDGYIYMSLDNRGTPAPKGRAWRKAIYRKIGQINIRDQAMAAKEILKWKYVDTSRIAIWGWSGGGASTLNALFQYPEVYKTGIAIAAITNELNYDNIYTERYMGLPQENMIDFTNCSPITHAKNLQGKLLYIHGTGDDNVHYANADQLINELVKHNKLFQFMAYPNRTHSISEGAGTRSHLSKTYTNFLKINCPPGAR
jgi:dipeptidyl-peptidase 4